MVEFVGVKSSLPASSPRRLARYDIASDAPPPERVTHLEGYERVAGMLGRPMTPADLPTAVASVDGDRYGVGIFVGNWLIGWRGSGSWQHIIEGRPEVVFDDGRGADVVAPADQLSRGDARGLMELTA
ncbi:MAG TPA: hypothetical protein DHW40_02035 [Microbacterium sp.]|nr:hypothetical protein [Microbacterium sp.]